MDVEMDIKTKTEHTVLGDITTLNITERTPDGKGVYMDMDSIHKVADLVEKHTFTDKHHSYIIRALAPQGWRTIKTGKSTIEDFDDYYNDYVKEIEKFYGFFQVQIQILH